MKCNNPIEKIPIVSFFSGGGFLDMGFEKAGFNIVYSNEIDKDFAQFYKEGMSSWSGESREISAICDINKVSNSEIKNLLEGQFGIIGGPPCQDFSIRGSKNGFDGLKGTLTYSYYEKIIDLDPDFFLMENVPGVVQLRKTKHRFQQILEEFKSQYLISSTILNALHFGVPQHRKRLFIFGLKKTNNNLKIIENFDNNFFNWPEGIYPNAEKTFVWELSNDLDLSKSTLPPDNLCVLQALVKNNEIEKVPNANEFFKIKNINKVSKIKEGDTRRPSFKRLHRRRYSPTACYGNNEVHLHPFENRRLSVREALRIQGVDDSYIISTKGKLSKKFKMIGNGVPVPLAYNVALAIKKLLKANEHIF